MQQKENFIVQIIISRKRYRRLRSALSEIVATESVNLALACEDEGVELAAGDLNDRARFEG